MSFSGTFIFMFWSAMTETTNSFLPVFRFYASLRRGSSLQGIAAHGAHELITATMPGLHKP